MEWRSAREKRPLDQQQEDRAAVMGTNRLLGMNELSSTKQGNWPVKWQEDYIKKYILSRGTNIIFFLAEPTARLARPRGGTAISSGHFARDGHRGSCGLIPPNRTRTARTNTAFSPVSRLRLPGYFLCDAFWSGSPADKVCQIAGLGAARARSESSTDDSPDSFRSKTGIGENFRLTSGVRIDRSRSRSK